MPLQPLRAPGSCGEIVAVLGSLLTECAAVAAASLDGHLRASITPPNTSLATIPVAYFGGTTERRPPANLVMLSKMRIVMIEKWEGHCWADCLANATVSPPLSCDTNCDVEHDMLATLKAVKALNPGVSTVFYWNTLLAFPFYAQVGKFRRQNALLIDVNTHSPLQLRNDNGMPQIWVYDYGKPVGQQLWQGMVANLVSSGVVDGIFGDKWDVYATSNASNGTNPTSGGWKVCNHWCGGLGEEQALAFNRGKNATLRAVEKFLGPDAVFFSATDDLVKHIKNPAEMIQHVNAQLAKAPYAYVYGARDQQPNHDPHNFTSECESRFVAMFLLAVEEGAFIGCNGWHADFAKPLGAPTTKALSNGTMMTRTFSSGTRVVWDVERNDGAIQWAR
eukprot:SAG31_NODE_371_length_16628_cov_3.741943_1_plen_391_part_00